MVSASFIKQNVLRTGTFISRMSCADIAKASKNTPKKTASSIQTKHSSSKQ
jgi:hypothetical protein